MTAETRIQELNELIRQAQNMFIKASSMAGEAWSETAAKYENEYRILVQTRNQLLEEMGL